MESKTTPQAVPSTAISTDASRTAAWTCRLDAMIEALKHITFICESTLEDIDTPLADYEIKRIHKLHHAGASAAAHTENDDHVAAVGHMPQEADDLN